MPQIPQFSREVKLNGQALPYEHYNLNEYMFGGGEAKALGNISEGAKELRQAVDNFNDKIDETKMLELSNQIDQWAEQTLYDKEKGYYATSGKDAVGKSKEIMQNYDDFVRGYLQQNKVSPANQARLNEIVNHKKLRISQGVNQHDIQQTEVWAKNESELGLNNAVKNMVQSRNNPEEMKIQIANIKSIIDWQAQVQNLDESTTAKLKEDAISNAHCAVIDSYIQEGSLQAGQYFEEHKDEINPQQHSKYIGAIKNEEMKYQARDMAANIIANAKSEQDAIKQAEAIEDVNMSDQVLSRVKRHYSEREHFKDLAERDALNNFYNTVIQKQQNGQTLSYDDIPDNVDPQTKLSLMNYVNKNGQPDTDDDVWETLYNKSVNDAQGFIKEDLNKYRGFLSESEYKQFVKRQQDIKTGGYYTVIQDDDKKIDAALTTIGLKKGRVGNLEKTAYSEIRALVREYEARKGRKINPNELDNIIKSLGYGENKVQIYKQLEKGMAERAGFIRDVVNDFAYYQSKHNGELPSDSDKWKIINNRLNTKIQEQNNQVLSMQDLHNRNAQVMRTVANVRPKPNEQKVLTYFADNQVPIFAKQLGLKLTVTSRYRADKNSHHSEGRALDISMSEHNATNRIRIYTKLLNSPYVDKVGCSDPNILSHFNGNAKLVDERKYDRQHGTNHKNHAHVTLINANPVRPTGNRVASNGTYRF